MEVADRLVTLSKECVIFVQLGFGCHGSYCIHHEMCGGAGVCRISPRNGPYERMTVVPHTQWAIAVFVRQCGIYNLPNRSKSAYTTRAFEHLFFRRPRPAHLIAFLTERLKNGSGRVDLVVKHASSDFPKLKDSSIEKFRTITCSSSLRESSRQTFRGRTRLG